MSIPRPRRARASSSAPFRRGKAVVLGGSLAGLLTARVLARHFGCRPAW